MAAQQSAVGDLRQQTAVARALLFELATLDLENDETLQRDMVEGSTDLHEAIRGAICRIIELRARKTGIASTMQVLANRRDRFNDQEDRIRAALLTAMEAGGLQKLETPLGTVYRRAVAPSLVVTDEALIPERFWLEQAPKIDRRTLLDALKGQASIPGAELSNGGTTIALKLT